jgi:hypothetical protein
VRPGALVSISYSALAHFLIPNVLFASSLRLGCVRRLTQTRF